MGNRTFGERLQEAMAKNNISALGLKARTGVNERTIHNYIHDKQPNPNKRVVEKIAKSLHTTSRYLLYGDTSTSGVKFKDFKALRDGLKFLLDDLGSDEKFELISMLSTRKK